MNEKMNEAINQITDRHLAEAVNYRKRHYGYWVAAAAAILALVLCLTLVGKEPGKQNVNMDVPTVGLTPTLPAPTTPVAPMDPMPTTMPPTMPSTPPAEQDPEVPRQMFNPMEGLELPDLLASPLLPTMMRYPNYDDFEDDYRAYREAVAQWQDDQKAFYNQPDGYADSLTDFFTASITQFLSGDKNSTYSPVNVYLAMAMLAETTDGDSRQQILDLFGLESIEDLRTQAKHLWNAHYSNDGFTTLLLGNSLWLDDAFGFNQETVERLEAEYFASTFHGDLGTDASNAQLHSWLNAMTGGLLEDQAKNVELSPNATFALASTVYFQASWADKFPEIYTHEGIFHGITGDTSATYMQTYVTDRIFHGSNFSAVRLALSGNNDMWIILPDAGVDVATVLAGEEYLRLTLDPASWSDYTYARIHLTLPKFDVTSQCDLINGMKNMGVYDIFDSSLASFDPMITYNPMDGKPYISQINHAARVKIDEEGVEAAAFTIIEAATDSVPPEPQDFVVDRPFIFIVSSRDQLPLFAGTVILP